MDIHNHGVFKRFELRLVYSAAPCAAPDAAGPEDPPAEESADLTDFKFLYLRLPPGMREPVMRILVCLGAGEIEGEETHIVHWSRLTPEARGAILQLTQFLYGGFIIRLAAENQPVRP